MGKGRFFNFFINSLLICHKKHYRPTHDTVKDPKGHNVDLYKAGKDHNPSGHKADKS